MNRKSLSILAFAIALALALSACAPTEAPSPSVQPTAEPTPTAAPTDEVVAEPTSAPEVAILTDMVGRQVELPAQVETVVSLASSNTEILYAIGAGDMLIGRDSYSDYPEEVADVAVVGDFNGPNIEAIAEAQPDVVLASSLLEDVINQLTDLGITVFCTEASDYEGIYTSIELIGTICGKTEEASTLCTQMRETIDAVHAAAAAPTAGGAGPACRLRRAENDHGHGAYWRSGGGHCGDHPLHDRPSP